MNDKNIILRLQSAILAIPAEVRRTVAKNDPEIARLLFPAEYMPAARSRPDLHALTRAKGTPTIAESLGCSIRALEEMRRGYTALTIDDLYELDRQFESFDMVATVRRIGEARERKGRNRKSRNSMN